MHSAGNQIAPNTIAGALTVYVLFPLIVLSIIGAARWAIRHDRRMDIFERGLALLIQDVTPPNGRPLRELVTDMRVEMANLRGEVTTLSAAIAGRDPRDFRPEGRPRP